MFTLGVDLAAAPSNTAACSIDWSGDPPAVRLHPDATDDSGLLALARQADKVGIDCPFGWPQPFVDAVSAHASGAAWPGRDLEPEAYRRRLRFRATDFWAWDLIGRPPLSVAADRIGVTAMRLCGLLDQLELEGYGTDRTGTGLVAEVYPAGALSRWSLPHLGYKGNDGRAVRESLLTQLLSNIALDVTAEDKESLLDSDHACDALVAALVA